MPLPYTLPVTRTWAPKMQVKAPYLRGSVADAVALLNNPAVFIGTQVSAQSVANSTDQVLNIDTEAYDNGAGHIPGTPDDDYFGQFPGWYVAQGGAGLNYTGGVGMVRAGVSIAPNAGAPTVYYGQSLAASGTSGQIAYPVVAKLLPIVAYGNTVNSDIISLYISGSTGASHNTYVGASQLPQLQLQWVCAASGTAPLPVPTNDAWAPAAPTSLTAQANSGTASLQVASAAGLVAGGTLGLDQATPALAETVTVAGTYTLGSLTVPLTAALAHTHASGAPVTVPVSAAFLNKNIRDTIAFLVYPPTMEAYYAAGTQTLATQSSLPTAGTTVQCDTKRFDNYGAFNVSTHVWTAPVAGVYWCYGQAKQGASSTTQAIAAGLTVTSANYAGGTTTTLWGGTQALDSGAGDCAVVRRRLRLNAGDTVALAAFQKDSGTASTTLTYASGPGTGNATVVVESRLITCWRSA